MSPLVAEALPSEVARAGGFGVTYQCTCQGFRTLRLIRMCLRCLDAYDRGIEQVLKGTELLRHKKLVGTRLLQLLEDNPITVNQALDAANRAEGLLLPNGLPATPPVDFAPDTPEEREMVDRATNHS